MKSQVAFLVYLFVTGSPRGNTDDNMVDRHARSY